MARDYSVQELHDLLQHSNRRFYLVDTLPHEAYHFRHLPGAVSLPLEELEARAAEVLPDKSAEIITYCASPT